MSKHVNGVITTEEYVRRAIEVHGNKFDYSQIKYVGSKDKVIVICKEHGPFLTPAGTHVTAGYGCNKCTGLMPQEKFIEKVISIHGDIFNFPEKYIGINKKINIECKKHGMFLRTPTHLFIGRGCNKCKNENSQHKFLKKAKEVHGDKYDYSLVKFINSDTKVKIICKSHGVFDQLPHNHTGIKRGCPTCRESKGAKEVRIFLEKNKIEYIKEHKFDDCRDIRPLPFDFYLPELNMCIEYNGEQHYRHVDFFHRERNPFKSLVKKDKIKVKYCTRNNIKLLIIRFDEDVETKLKEFLNHV